MLTLDFQAYNPATRKFNALPPDGSVVNGNRHPDADPWRPFWDVPQRQTSANQSDWTLPAQSSLTLTSPAKTASNNIVQSAPGSPWHLSEAPAIDVMDTINPAETLLSSSYSGEFFLHLRISYVLISFQEGVQHSPAPCDNLEPFDDLAFFGSSKPFEDQDVSEDAGHSVDAGHSGDPGRSEDPGHNQDAGLSHTGHSQDEDAEAASMEWEAFKIIGEELVDGEVHYMVAWKPTLEPERNLTHLQGLLKEWKQARAKRVAAKKPRIRIHLRKASAAASQALVKRGRGRPRKLH